MPPEPTRHDGAPDLLLARLELFGERLINILRAEREAWSVLGDLGHVAVSSRDASPADAPNVVRAKEALLRLERERQQVLRELNAIGALIADPGTGEILVKGGPVEGSYLSWMPGEPNISWWREGNTVDSPRRPLPGINFEALGSNHH